MCYNGQKHERRVFSLERRASAGVKTEKEGELDKIAYEYLKKKIILGELKPGQSITEIDISKELNMSRTPVRAALKMLGNEKLVKLFPSKGAFVSELTMRDIEELFGFRILLESEALKYFVQFAPDGVIDGHIKVFESCLDMGEFSEDYHLADSMFHMDIMKYIRNSRILETYVQLLDQIDRARHIAALDPRRVRSTPVEHMEILEYAKARDLEKATDALIKHLKSVEDSTLDSFRNVY